MTAQNQTTEPTGGMNSADALRLRQQYVAALSQFINRLSLPADALGRVRQRLAGARNSPVEAMLEQIAAELERRQPQTALAAAPPASVPGETAPPTATEPPGDAIADVLLTLFERITLSPLTEQAAGKRREQLLQGISAEELPRFVNDLAELISQSLLLTQREKQELEEFIGHILEQLRRFDAFVRCSEADMRECRDNQAAFEQQWDEGAQGMAEQVSRATDLEQLKRDVNTQLEQMRECMSEFRERESDRRRRSEQANAEMHEKLDQMREETTQLRSRLQENRARLMRDSITGVHSRFAYEERIELEHVRWKRFDAPLSLMLWDIDFFKSINDTFGHKAGDRVLQLVAQLIDSRIRESDFFARVGGEEFVMLLPGTGTAEAERIAEQIRTLVEEADFKHKGNPVQITLSCGLSEFREGDSPEQVFDRADEALYQAKQAGRNRCIAA